MDQALDQAPDQARLPAQCTTRPASGCGSGVLELDISASAADLHAALAEVAARYGTAGHPEFLDRLPVLRSLLPQRVVLELTGAMAGERAHAVVIRGFPLGDEVRPTPAHWRDTDPRATAIPDSYLVLLASLLGEPFGWSSLQGGRLINDILPIRHAEQSQTGHSSSTPLQFHCEDAFHELRCDYLGLVCLRNPDRVATTVGRLDVSGLAPADREVLRQPRFVIRPDDEHLRNSDAARDRAAWPRVPVLFGHPRTPYLRIDPPYMSSLPGDEPAASALRRIGALLRDRLEDVVLGPGDVCFIDNYRAVHGRAPFRARYDGTDRWLRKVVVSRDLRRSRAWRAHPRSRIVRPTREETPCHPTC